MRRRHLLGAGSAAVALAGCQPQASAPPLPPTRWLGAAHERGHRLRALGRLSASGASGVGSPASGTQSTASAAVLPVPAVQRRTNVLVLGGGVAGLSALRRLALAGVDAQLLELGEQVGGNSQGHRLAGMACPLGAHYLPVPGPAAPEVRAWLQDIDLLHWQAGVLRPRERHLCHAPQERLFIDGAWQDGLLPSAEGRPATLAQYRRFATLVSQARRTLAFSIPTLHSHWTPAHSALDAQTFAHWLATQGLNDARLLAYLDYSCRDDYGAGLTQVSAWAGLHYFASRHGFHAPGDDGPQEAEREPVFTWPQGNGFLVDALAQPLRERLLAGRTVLHISEQKHSVQVLAWNEATQQAEGWTAQAVIVALPLFIAARLLPDWANPLAAALRQAAQQQSYAPWLVANLHLAEPLLERLGAPPAWDNVRFAPAGSTTALGYVNAMHQSLLPYSGASVLTAYHALPVGQRGALLAGSAAHWGQAVLADLATLHPDAPHKVRTIELVRWGHAMSIPAPGVRSAAWLAALRPNAKQTGRIRFAHSDLAGYSVFEEAFTLGWHAASGDTSGQAIFGMTRGNFR